MEKFSTVWKLVMVENNNGRLGALGNCDEKIQHSGKHIARVGNSEGRRLTVRRNKSSKKFVCNELQNTLSNGLKQ
jgi:hypothetical protein